MSSHRTPMGDGADSQWGASHGVVECLTSASGDSFLWQIDVIQKLNYSACHSLRWSVCGLPVDHNGIYNVLTFAWHHTTGPRRL
jgi:hypothetical protein